MKYLIAGSFAFFCIYLVYSILTSQSTSISSQSPQLPQPTVKASMVWEDTDAPTFHGDICTDDCSGHEAGYEWAADKGITDPDDCGGNSQSFIEGCESYAEENYESDYYDDEGGDYY